ncbi:hypothetical protein LTR37_001280 [Vermiconidia calcicola]|uniref:Uncharacterized protein n=1 Tax=Vermiconidia calcicola TaxID=1690605 RepID=A0ACC3NWF9_9PEZI|nr:hypothetical protein LTR37_001280 [Vermiconidia calcicola]
MVVVRESPNAKLSPDKNSTQWPPKSPFQALLSSPSGRRKWQDRRNNREDERSVSPSPIKRSLESSRKLQAMSGADEEDEEGEDEDEETLQLKLQAIQAKLKLKKLRQKAKGDSNGNGSSGSGRASSRADFMVVSPTKSKIASSARPRVDRGDVEVPLSPTKDRNVILKEQPSPARRRLGLTNDFKAQDVSLKRARDGTQIKRSDSARRTETESAAPKLSFSERLNRSREETKDELIKQARIEKTRSTGFGHKAQLPTDEPRANGRATPKSASDVKRPSSAHQMHASNNTEKEAAVSRGNSTRTSRPERANVSRANGISSSRPQQDESNSTPPAENSDQPSPGFDPFSQTHLSKRYIPHPDVARALSDKEIYTLPHLLKEVKAPHYDPPDCEADFVLFAILASKSSPFDQKAAHRTSDEKNPQEDSEAPRNKFMVLHLCDLKWEVDCFLFGTAFTQFWKLTPGTLLAILNPAIMPPKGNQHNGRFCLKLGSSEDCVMEIGLARDLGYCDAVKKDGQACGQWIDKKSTEICEFHLNLEIDRNRKHRMEVNTMWRSHNGKGGASENWKPKSESRRECGFDNRLGGNKKGQAEKNKSFHREYGQLYSVPSAGGAGRNSAASLLDAEDMDALQNMSASEASRKRIADAQRERELARRLGEMGNGMGAEYLRVTTQTNTTSEDTTLAKSTPYFEKPSAQSLGLLGKRAEDQHLSPVKDRKRHFGTGAISSAGPEAMGWGGARKAGLLQPKDNRMGSPEKGQTKLGNGGKAKPGIVRNRSEDGSLSPKKRARFALEKGIREPGRESLGEELKGLAPVDDEDDLDIV